MISLSQDCLLFELASGESIPFSSEMISIELMGDAAGKFDPAIIQDAAASVFHYFKHDLARQTVSVGEFAEALEKALRGLGFNVRAAEPGKSKAASSGTDLRALARESGDACELFFFPRVRDELRAQLRDSQRVARFRGLRACVKHLTGARRWSPRCQSLHDHIVSYLRECLGAETRDAGAALLVE